MVKRALTAIFLVALLGSMPLFAAKAKAKENPDFVQKMMSDMRAWANALAAYKVDYNRYPTAANINALRTHLVPGYAKTLPLVDPWGNHYSASANGETFHIVRGGDLGLAFGEFARRESLGHIECAEPNPLKKVSTKDDKCEAVGYWVMSIRKSEQQQNNDLLEPRFPVQSASSTASVEPAR
jgi:hypothetical protein